MDHLPPDDNPKPPQKHAAAQYKRHLMEENLKVAPPSSPADTGGRINLKDGSARITPATDTDLHIPKKPQKNDPIYEWFDFYYQCRLQGFNYSFKDLTEDTGLKPGYMRLLYQQYRREHHLD